MKFIFIIIKLNIGFCFCNDIIAIVEINLEVFVMNATTEAAWLDSQIAACAVRKKALCADERKDEANFEQIRMNVYNIFKSVLSVAAACGGEEAQDAFFERRLATIPQAWREALAKAEAHQDTEKAQIERIKLEALENIRGHFVQTRGERA